LLLKNKTASLTKWARLSEGQAASTWETSSPCTPRAASQDSYPPWGKFYYGYDVNETSDDCDAIDVSDASSIVKAVTIITALSQGTLVTAMAQKTTVTPITLMTVTQ